MDGKGVPTRFEMEMERALPAFADAWRRLRTMMLATLLAAMALVGLVGLIFLLSSVVA
jgi:hypothetical protein